MDLPEAFCSGFPSLTYLGLYDATALQKLPEGIGGLNKSLRELVLLGCTAVDRLPEGIGCLTSLRSLRVGPAEPCLVIICQACDIL